MTLYNLLLNIHEKNWKELGSVLAASSGKAFENQIETLLSSNSSYLPIHKDKYRKSPFYNQIKSEIISSNYHEDFFEIDGINEYFKLEGRRIIISQPHGANNYPDFLLISNNKILPLEIKFSTKNGDKPVWNSGYPRSKSIYIFGSFGLRDISAFNGDDYLIAAERSALLYASSIADNAMQNQINNDPNIRRNKFEPYMRAMYNQKFSTLRNENRSLFEQNAFNLARSSDF